VRILADTNILLRLLSPADSDYATVRSAVDALAGRGDRLCFVPQSRVSDSGEGRWTITAAIDEGAPAPVLSAALYQRFASRGEEEFGDKLLSAMRFEFGGHIEKKQ
jgi:6-phosphogluconate dehydrogenase